MSLGCHIKVTFFFPIFVTLVSLKVPSGKTKKNPFSPCVNPVVGDVVRAGPVVPEGHPELHRVQLAGGAEVAREHSTAGTERERERERDRDGERKRERERRKERERERETEREREGKKEREGKRERERKKERKKEKQRERKC